MTVPAPVTMTKEAFLAWVERREERYEFAGGRVIKLVRVTVNHSLVATNLLVAPAARLPRERYDVVVAAFAVHVGDSIRFPDVLVEPARRNGKSLRAERPILIVEVLSPGSLHLDFGDKRREYLALPTLDTYLVVSPDEPRIWVWQRADGTFPSEPEIIEGEDQQIALPALAITIPFPDIYDGVCWSGA
jgi:Uma2 family endonuclease